MLTDLTLSRVPSERSSRETAKYAPAAAAAMQLAPAWVAAAGQCCCRRRHGRLRTAQLWRRSGVRPALPVLSGSWSWHQARFLQTDGHNKLQRELALEAQPQVSLQQLQLHAVSLHPGYMKELWRLPWVVACL